MLTTLNIERDIEEIKKKRRKVVVSLSLNAENLEILKADLKKHDLTLSGLFDVMLENIVEGMKKNKSKKERGKSES